MAYTRSGFFYLEGQKMPNFRTQCSVLSIILSSRSILCPSLLCCAFRNRFLKWASKAIFSLGFKLGLASVGN